MLVAVLLVMILGGMLVATASPAVAERIGLESFYFIKRQLFFLLCAGVCVVFFSLLSPIMIRRVAVVGFILGVVALILVLLLGDEAKGAKRWLYIAGFSLQPSEFVKPFFIIVTAWCLSAAKSRSDFNSLYILTFIYGLFVFLLILQPDFGMVILVSLIWATQLFVSGFPLIWITGFVLILFIGCLLAYSFLPHVAYRINNFIAATGDNYQINKAIQAFKSGGFTGKGPGEGVVKQYLPDSHTDFIFAVAGEEFGAVLCLSIIFLYAVIVFRGFKRISNEIDLFIIYATSGLLVQFAMQAIINIGVALHLLPTKGMTLPFISYGGSSLLATAIGVGMILSLTRKKYGMFTGVSRLE